MGRSRVSRALRLLALAAVAGALTTVAVSWSIAVWSYTVGSPVTQGWVVQSGKALSFGRSAGPGMEQVYWSVQSKGTDMDWARDQAAKSAAFPVWCALAEPGEPERLMSQVPVTGSPHSQQVFEIATGWPLIAMRARLHDAFWMAPPPLAGPPYQAMDGIQVSTHWVINGGSRAGQARALPLTPLWSGFAVNTVVYAVLWSVALVGFAAWRRSRRKRKGACEKCGYDLSGQTQSGCPECGWGRVE
ncbi:MAG: hypothetical protein ACREJO_02765, partial [Phycisphaerales bacterium]